MNIIFFTHPSFLNSQSMPRYAKMLVEGMSKKGHNVELWTAKPRFYKLPLPPSFKKWLGYIDQFIIFPFEVRKRLKKCPSDTLFVFTDNALGPWVPLVKNRAHVIHCHDFLAQYSALGKIPENPTKWSGRQYQKYIRNGYSKGKNFISVSEKTRNDLLDFLEFTPDLSVVVYNPLNPLYKPQDKITARNKAMQQSGIDLQKGYILHVGGNSWYKNRLGLIRLYVSWRLISKLTLPLIIVGAATKEESTHKELALSFKNDIHFITGTNDEMLSNMYAGANLFLFPSLAEGFGWPIIEAMASACPVITTGITPITEVGVDAAYYIPRKPMDESQSQAWAMQGADVIEKIIMAGDEEIRKTIDKGLENIKRFDLNRTIEKIEDIYQEVLSQKS